MFTYCETHQEVILNRIGQCMICLGMKVVQEVKGDVREAEHILSLPSDDLI